MRGPHRKGFDLIPISDLGTCVLFGTGPFGFTATSEATHGQCPCDKEMNCLMVCRALAAQGCRWVPSRRGPLRAACLLGSPIGSVRTSRRLFKSMALTNVDVQGDGESIKVHVVAEAAFAAWLEGQPSSRRAWLDQIGYEPSKHASAPLPADQARKRGLCFCN